MCCKAFSNLAHGIPLGVFFRGAQMFKGRHFDQSVILLCVRWYLAYSLTLRDLKEMMAERGISIDHSTIHHWVVHFSPLRLERFNRRKRAVTPASGMRTRRTSSASGCISTAPSTVSVTRSSSFSANTEICRRQSVSSQSARAPWPARSRRH